MSQSQRIANVRFAQSLSLLAILMLIPSFLSTSAWFLAQTGISFFVHVYALFTPYHSLLVVWTVGGPGLAVVLLALSFILGLEPGHHSLSGRWIRWSLFAVGILLSPTALALCIHAILGT